MKLYKLIYSLKKRLFSIYSQAKQNWQDVLSLVILATVAGIASFQGSQFIDPINFNEQVAGDVWFHGDAGRVFTDMTVHDAPLFVEYHNS